MDALTITFLLFAPTVYALLLVTERLWPARRFPPRRGWQWLGVAFLLLQTSLGIVVPLLIPTDWLAEHRLIDGTGLGVLGGWLVGFVLLELVVYTWHRSAHSFSPMWRAFHQLHHAPARVDVPGSQVFHPLEMSAYTVLYLVVTVFVIGLDPLAAALVGATFAFAGLFQHWNVRTPRWVGYVIQRPEAHCVHHRKGFHNYNFADLTWWDMLFGTFRNPAKFEGECGFEGGGETRYGAMLAFQDVNAPLYGPGNRGRKAAARAPATVPHAA